MMEMILGFPTLALSASDLYAWHGQLVRVSIALTPHKSLYECEALTLQDGAALSI